MQSSEGSVYDYNQQAYALLEFFEQKVIAKLLQSKVVHADETGINIGGKNHWLHCISSPQWTLYYAHSRRGLEAMNSKPLLALFNGVLVYDHWKPYFKLECLHAHCNARHLRELMFAHEQEGQAWAKNMRDLLDTILSEVHVQGGVLAADRANHYIAQYRAILEQAERECPLPPESEGTKRQQGRIKRTKSRN